MPKIKANNITMNYDQQGTGDPLILIPYLTADHACYVQPPRNKAKRTFRRISCKLLKRLVAAVGLEPTTYGL